ncbi:DAK2 domain-containing protein [Demequina oxidasica]|uniref:DAK2 domain-containing protein n=1 Tax=Demequina oxidasica TaxID=676199 RepID=UPI000780CA28|nr:DAK2 domain-containing protein [Demequina oxidasica]
MSETANLRHWLESGAKAIKGARTKLDAINVFPVPDSDTGTNMYLTLQEGNRAVSRLPATASHREVVAAFVRGALMGARGNSGVIVSQYLSAFLTGLDERGGLDKVGAQGIAEALDEAADAAYGAVLDPVEGTILSVARAAAKGAADTLPSEPDRSTAIVAAVLAARTALAQTHEDLPSAKAAGVVDAGAAGLVLQLESLAENIAGADALDALDEVDWEIRGGRERIGKDQLAHTGHAAGGAYEVMFVVAHDTGAGATLRDQLGKIGDSVAVTGSHGLWQAHVHTDAPHLAVEVAHAHKSHQMLVRNVALSHIGDRASTGVVALTTCPGLAEPLADAGAVVLVVPDPAALKPRALVRAVKDASGRAAVVAAGHPALRAAALKLADKRSKPALTVLRCTHEAQVVAAVAASALITPGQDIGEQMADAVAATSVGSSTGDSLDDDVDRLLSRSTEVVTLVLADGINPGVADAVRLSARTTAPEADINVYLGGHAEPAVLIGVENPPAH